MYLNTLSAEWILTNPDIDASEMTKQKLFRYRCFSIVLISYLSGVNAQASSGNLFLNSKEALVRQISDAAGLLASDCDLLDSCASECTRAVCTPQREDVGMSLCLKVQNNPYCPAVNPASKNCREMKLNYNKSYLTLPRGADPANLQPEVIRDICLQRRLEKTFKNISTPETYFYAYFGSTSGAWRAFPGLESSEETTCTNLEARQRPWYLDAISVLKQVVILVDTGNSMGTAVGPEFKRDVIGTTYLDVSNDIALSIIQTMSPGDYVSVISFNSSGGTSLGSPVNVGTNTQNSLGIVLHPELDPLQSSVRSLTHSAAPQPSNLTAAIIMAAATFQNTTKNSLKLVIVISDGYILPLDSTTFPTREILALQSKLFIYKLPPSNDEDRFLVKTSLKTVLCGVEGSFEVLNPPATVNPLFAINSYFSYLAQIHMLVVGSKPTWSNKYESLAQILNAVTVTSPAFDRDGRLIGVAGIDVYIDELEPTLQTSVIEDFDTSGRKRGSFPAPSTIPLSCSYQMNQTESHICSSATLPTSDQVICKQTDSRSLQQRVCCNSCAISPPPPPFARWKILALVASGVAILGVIVASVILIYRRPPWKRSNAFDPVYTGPTQED